MKKRIFTFWEPKENLTGYIRLCIKTWEKHLPEYEIVVCDYDNLKNYLPKKVVKAIVCKKMSLAMQSDAIRSALLKYHAGIWMDADTIITTSSVLSELDKSNCTMIGRKSDEVIYGAFIYTRKPNCDFMNEWFKACLSHIRLFRKARIFKKIGLCKKLYKKTRNWDWCSNAIIDPLAKKMNSKEFYCVDKNELNALPEYTENEILKNEDKLKNYQEFWFKQGDYQSILSENKGIILLHNSWTPIEYKKMDEDQFLKQDILLSKLLKEVLK